MEVSEDIVIVGAGIAGLTTSLALNRLGIKSLVLESSDSLRSTGFAFSTWTNAWKALDAIGISDSLRRQHLQLSRITTISTISGLETSDMSLKLRGKRNRDHEVRCVKRKTLLETLSQQLPNSTIRYSSKVVSIEESGFFKVVHLADGTILKTKVLIGCDGVNSVVAKWLGFKKPILTGRCAIRGYAIFNDNHSFEPKFMQFFGGGNRYGVIPCDGNSVYWFFTWTPSSHEKEIGENPAKMKQYVLSKLGKAPHNIQAVIENTKLEDILTSPLVYRYPFELLWGNISKGSVCIAGDALHPMTPDVGQGGCSALEDGVVLARCLAEALLQEPNRGREKDDNKQEKEEYKRIDMGLRRYAKERRMRSFELVSTAYLVGVMQQSNGKIMTLMRDKCLAAFLAGLLLKRAEYDCGRLKV